MNKKLVHDIAAAEPRSAPVIEEGCGCRTYWDGDRTFTIYCAGHRPARPYVAATTE